VPASRLFVAVQDDATLGPGSKRAAAQCRVEVSVRRRKNPANTVFLVTDVWRRDLQRERALPPPRLRWQRMTSGQFKRERHDGSNRLPSIRIAAGGFSVESMCEAESSFSLVRARVVLALH
jgi:hypothetical protein